MESFGDSMAIQLYYKFALYGNLALYRIVISLMLFSKTAGVALAAGHKSYGQRRSLMYRNQHHDDRDDLSQDHCSESMHNSRFAFAQNEILSSRPGPVSKCRPGVVFFLDKSNRVFDYINEDVLDCQGHQDSWDWGRDAISLDARRKDTHSSTAVSCRHEGSSLVRRASGRSKEIQSRALLGKGWS